MTAYRVPNAVVDATFGVFRKCGQARKECQALWIGPWHSPELITDVVHPRHRANADGFQLDDAWLNAFWVELARVGKGVRVQVHTHPFAAFHSETDDAFPIIHTAGFLSLVIPNFATGPIGFKDAYLAEIGEDGHWREVAISTKFVIVQ